MFNIELIMFCAISILILTHNCRKRMLMESFKIRSPQLHIQLWRWVWGEFRYTQCRTPTTLFIRCSLYCCIGHTIHWSLPLKQDLLVLTGAFVRGRDSIFYLLSFSPLFFFFLGSRIWAIPLQEISKRKNIPWVLPSTCKKIFFLNSRILTIYLSVFEFISPLLNMYIIFYTCFLCFWIDFDPDIPYLIWIQKFALNG